MIKTIYNKWTKKVNKKDFIVVETKAIHQW